MRSSGMAVLDSPPDNSLQRLAVGAPLYRLRPRTEPATASHLCNTAASTLLFFRSRALASPPLLRVDAVFDGLAQQLVNHGRLEGVQLPALLGAELSHVSWEALVCLLGEVRR